MHESDINMHDDPRASCFLGFGIERMKASKTGLCVYRGLYWANQGLLHAVRALREAEAELELDHGPASPLLNDNLRRTQAMIEETRALMNRNLAEWIERREKE